MLVPDVARHLAQYINRLCSRLLDVRIDRIGFSVVGRQSCIGTDKRMLLLHRLQSDLKEAFSVDRV